MSGTFICYNLGTTGSSASYRARAVLGHLADEGLVKTVITGNSEDRIGGLKYHINRIQERPGKLLRAWQRLHRLPEPEISWTHSCMRIKEIEDSLAKSAFVFMTTPPHSVNVLGVHAKRAHRCPLIIDLRDDWGTRDRQNWRTPLHKAVGLRIEKETLQAADAIILNTELLRQRFLARFPAFKEKMFVVTNGYCEADYKNAEAPDISSWRIPKSFLIVYTGSPYGRFVPTQLERLLRQVNLRNPRVHYQVVTAGYGVLQIPQDLRRQWIHFPSLTPSQCAGLMRDGDLLLLAMPPGEREPSATIPLKTFSYLRSKREIIYVGERGETSSLLESFDGTTCKNRGFWDEMPNWLLAKSPGGKDIRRDVSRFEFDFISEQIAEIIRRVIV